MDLFLEDIKSHFKLDFIDKIIISVVFIIGAILCPFYAYASEVEEIPFTVLPGVGMNVNYDFFVTSNYSIGYIQVEPGYSYIVSNNSSTSNKVIGFSSSVPEVNSSVNVIGRLLAGDNYSFTGSDYGFLYFDLYSYSDSVSITRTKLFGMEEFIDNLTFYNGLENLWNVFISIIPYIFVVLLVCIGLLFIRRLAIYLSKGKTRI